MPDYIDGKQVSPASVQNINVEAQKAIDVDVLAAAVAKAIGCLPVQVQRVGVGTGGELVDTFDNERSLERLAESMVVQRGNASSNFEDLGKTKETKKNIKDTDAVRDILKGLD